MFDFVQKELAPKAAEIDKANDFPGMRVYILWHFKKLCSNFHFVIDIGLLEKVWLFGAPWNHSQI